MGHKLGRQNMTTRDIAWGKTCSRITTNRTSSRWIRRVVSISSLDSVLGGKTTSPTTSDSSKAWGWWKKIVTPLQTVGAQIPKTVSSSVMQTGRLSNWWTSPSKPETRSKRNPKRSKNTSLNLQVWWVTSSKTSFRDRMPTISLAPLAIAWDPTRGWCRKMPRNLQRTKELCTINLMAGFKAKGWSKLEMAMVKKRLRLSLLAPTNISFHQWEKSPGSQVPRLQAWPWPTRAW